MFTRLSSYILINYLSLWFLHTAGWAEAVWNEKFARHFYTWTQTFWSWVQHPIHLATCSLRWGYYHVWGMCKIHKYWYITSSFLTFWLYFWQQFPHKSFSSLLAFSLYFWILTFGPLFFFRLFCLVLKYLSKRVKSFGDVLSLGFIKYSS